VELISSVSALPSNFELNSKEGYDLFGNDINKIITLTGINKRHLAPEGMSTLDLAYAAANRLIELNNINRSEIALIVYVSFTFENRLPGDVNKLVSLLKLPNNIIAIDLSSACSGYLTGLLMVS
jgi:3-oxoacyl-[acyl-carrier-protein] synthase-3